MHWFNTTLTIASGQTLSPAVDLSDFGHRYVRRILIMAPSTLPETVTMRVSLDDSTYATLQSGGTDIILPADKATQVNGFHVRYLKLLAGGAVGGDRLFTLAITAE